MSTKPIRILLVEDNPEDARLIKEMLAEAQDFTVTWVARLTDALEQLAQDQINVVLLDLGLPDSQGLDTYLKARTQAPRLPLVVLTALADEDLALAAVQKGAQDYLYKDEANANLLLRAIRYATERKQTELTLESERNKLQAVLNGIPAFVHLKGEDLSIRFANRRFTEAFGIPGDKHCYELLRGRSKPCENCPALEVLQNQIPDKSEWTNPRNGRIFEVYHYPFRTDDEQFVLTLALDITERKRAEEAIRDQQEQLATIYDHAPLIMMLVDAECRVCKMNKLAEECAGAVAADLIGRRGGEALRCRHALDDPEGCGFGPFCQTCLVRRTVVETLETGLSHHQVEASLPFLVAEGPQDLTFLLSTARLTLGGQHHVLITVQDISKRKEIEEALRQSEKHYRSLFDNMLNGFAYCKMLFEHGQPYDFIFLNVNRAFGTLTGLQHVVGKRVSEILPGVQASDPELFELCGRVALTGVPALSETFVNAMGEWLSLSLYCPEKNYFVAVFDVITERKKGEEALRQSGENLRYMASQLLHAQERERRRIAHELHDDLGQSLLLLKLQMSIMARGLPPELQKSRQECDATVENVQEIIDSVRRLSHDLIPPALAGIGLKSAIKGLLAEFCHHQGIFCSVDIDDLKGLFPIDIKLIIYRIIQESLTNIGKYAQATQVSISLKRNGDQVYLSVEDNGKGFEVEQVMARRGRNRGLGLASMEERARMLGGTLHIWSAPDMGTKIQVSVPLKKLT